METPKLVSIADLLRSRRPISGTATLLTSPPPPLPPLPPAPPASSTHAKTLNPSVVTYDTKVLKSLSQPSVIIGTLTLGDSLPSKPRSCHSCFSFSDNSASVCCDVLDFDFRMIGMKIHILAWNFIPFKKCQGFLEIIKWKWPDGFVVTSSDTFPLVSDNVCKDSHKVWRFILGILESVSPVSFMPRSISGDANADDLCGFIAEILSCDCILCKSKGFDHLMQCNEEHSFSQTNFVFFRGTTLSWFPAVLKCIGKVILLSGLRKKLVYIGEEEVQLMLVSTKLTCVHHLKLQHKGLYLGNGRDGFESNGELGMYLGVVKSIYMQGMLVELDKEVWLLLTDQLCFLPHSIRVGAVISIRNVHILKPKFLWSKMLVLGTCYRSNISVVSFSPLETGCPLLSHSQSLLRRFIDSLVFPARLWVLLVVQCLRKKFSGAFSDKEIIGSKHKEGLVETYARSMLPSSVFHAPHNMFMEFCKHTSCGSHGSISYDSLSLAVPLSNFISNCDRIWIISLIQMKMGLKIVDDCSQFNNLFQENRLSEQSIRRILPSKEIGISLLGNLKISPATGRLQLIDATGGIDAVVPDLPSAWRMDAIYEVLNYSLVIEGTPELNGQAWIFESDLFSCGDIFRSVKVDRKTYLAVFVHFAWRDVIFRDFPILDCPSLKDSSSNLDCGAFHLLWLAHKFPMRSQFNIDLPASEKCFLFAEAMVLPCDLIIADSDDVTHPADVPQHGLQISCQSNFAFKRCKSGLTSSCIEKVVLCDNFSQFTNKSCGHSSNYLSLPCKRSADNFSIASPVQLPCTVTVRRISRQCLVVPGILSFTQDDGNCEIRHLKSPKTVLLEFNSENLFKYKSLQIGGYYIIKHCAEKCFCDSDGTTSGSKLVVNLETHLWSLSLHLNEVLLGSSISQSSCRHHLQNELLLHRCSIAEDHLIFYDVSLNVAEDAADFLDLDLQALMAAILNPSTRSREICGICEPVGCQNTVVNVFQTRGMYSENHLPQGNLISLIGTVVSIHSDCHSTDGVSCNGAASDIRLLRFTSDGKLLICLHVLTDGQMIDGYLNEHDYPIGLGPGATVTFHRILVLRQDHLRIMPVSVITVNTVREVSSPSSYSFCSVPEDNVASCFISDLVHYDACKPRRFRCRVVAIHIVMLERNRKLDKLLSDIHSAKPIVNVPLAGFVLDDGSSLCCCWANGARAATFLRLHEEMSQVGFGSSWLRSDGIGLGKACTTPSFYLDRILKRHGRVTVKNCGSINESSCQELQLSVGSDIIFGTQDEDLLKFIIFNACSSIPWCVIGHAMDSSSINELEKYLLMEQMNMHALENVWAREVCHVNTLAEARALYQDLS